MAAVVARPSCPLLRELRVWVHQVGIRMHLKHAGPIQPERCDGHEASGLGSCAQEERVDSAAGSVHHQGSTLCLRGLGEIAVGWRVWEGCGAGKREEETGAAALGAGGPGRWNSVGWAGHTCVLQDTSCLDGCDCLRMCPATPCSQQSAHSQAASLTWHQGRTAVICARCWRYIASRCCRHPDIGFGLRGPLCPWIEPMFLIPPSKSGGLPSQCS